MVSPHLFLRCFRSVVALVALAMSAPAQADPLVFDETWQERRFFLTRGNTYLFDGDSLGVVSRDSISLAYRVLPPELWELRQVSWDWAVSQSVPVTDLAQKGGDDRNLSIYFVFMDRDTAEKAGDNPKLRRLFRNRKARLLVYSWGGDYPRMQVMGSPYIDARAQFIMLRPAGEGSFSERIDLASDYETVFGGAPEVLVGIAISADSDDTNSAVRAEIRNLTLR